MKMNMDVFMPTRLFTGKGCVKQSGGRLALLGSSCLILTGKNSARACGALDDVTGVLDELDIRWEICDVIGQNPRIEDCMTAGKAAKSFGTEFILGIGGGSPLDAAKCAAVIAANEGITEERLFSMDWPVRPLPVAVVGTTAGTGSEVTKVAVITNSDGRKKSIRHDDIYPALAYGDPVYTMTLSSEFTRSTAIDALAHCVESYFNRNSNELSRSYAVSGIRLLMNVFRKAGNVEDYGCLPYDDREELYNASIYGGMAINITGTAMPHAVGYLLTEQHGFPHGAACAMLLPAFYAHNKKAVPELTEAFLRDVGFDEAEYLEMIKKVMPKYPLEITEEEIAREHDRWVDNASIAKSWGSISAEEVDSILRML